LDKGRFIDVVERRRLFQATRMDDEAKLLRKLESKNYTDEEAFEMFGGIEIKDLIKKQIIYYGSSPGSIRWWEESFEEKFYKSEKEKHEWDDLYDL